MWSYTSQKRLGHDEISQLTLWKCDNVLSLKTLVCGVSHHSFVRGSMFHTSDPILINKKNLKHVTNHDLT